MPDGTTKSWADPEPLRRDTPLLGLSQRLPPSNVQAEQALLGAILANNRAYERVEEFLRPEHFADQIHGRIFQAIVRRIDAGKIADGVTLIADFRNDGILEEVGGTQYIAQLVTAMVGVINAGEYGQVIRDAWVRREMIGLGEEVVNAGFDPEETPAEAAALYASSLDKISSLGANEKTAVSIEDAIRGALAQSATAFEKGGFLGVRSGFTALDLALRGFEPQGLYIIGARPGMGKTSWALQVANGIARVEAAPVAFFSLEMSREQLAMRLISMESAVSLEDMRSGAWKAESAPPSATRAIGDATIHLSRLPITIDDRPALTVDAIATACRIIKRKSRGLAAVVIDYLQLISPPRGADRHGPTNEITRISNALKQMAKRLDCPVIVLSQLSREVEKRENKRPMLSDLRQSGSLEQDADAVIFLYREEYYLKNSGPKRGPGDSDQDYASSVADFQETLAAVSGKSEWIIAKNRSGPTSTIEMGWEGSRTRFLEILDHNHA